LDFLRLGAAEEKRALETNGDFYPVGFVRFDFLTRFGTNFRSKWI
jgi:hypothetical protein